MIEMMFKDLKLIKIRNKLQNFYSKAKDLNWHIVFLHKSFKRFKLKQKSIKKGGDGLSTTKIRLTLFLSGLIVITSLLTAQNSYAEVGIINVYSAQKEALIRPLLERFEKQTGIIFFLVTGTANGLLKRLEIEGDMTAADIFIADGANKLQEAKVAGLLRAIHNPILEKRIPANLHDKDKFWFAISQRAHVLVYAKDRVKREEISSYENLADPKWKKRLCVSSATNISNQSLVASMIVENGEKTTEEWTKKLLKNSVTPQKGDDINQLKAVAAGTCDIALVNTNSLGEMIKSKESNEITKKLAIFWPNQGLKEPGVYINISGAGITKYARHARAAQRLLEFLITNESQKWYSETNNEYPVVPRSPVSATLKSFGNFKVDKLSQTIVGENNKKAVKLMKRIGWK